MHSTTPQQLSSTLLRQQADSELSTQEANRQKIMQEVFDMSVNNEVQTQGAKELLSAESRAQRSAGRRAQTAESEANISKSWMVMRDNQLEQAEAAFVTMNADPSAESYGVVREMLVRANPMLTGTLPKEFSKQAMDTVTKVQRSWLNSKQFRQKMEQMGYDRNTQYGLASQKFGNDASMLKAEYKLKMEAMTESFDRKDSQLAFGMSSGDRRALWQASPYRQLAEEYREMGDDQSALKFLSMAVDAENAMAQARATGVKAGDPLADQTKRAKLVEGRAKQLDWLLQGDYSNVAAAYDKQTKTFKAGNATAIGENLFRKAEEFGVPVESQANWAQERMIVWPDGKTWLELPLDAEGLPLGGWPASEIRSLVGKKVPEFRTGISGTIGSSTTEKINDLDEALEYYNYVIKLDYDIDILKTDFTQ